MRNVAVRRTIPTLSTSAAARRYAPLYTGLVHRQPRAALRKRAEVLMGACHQGRRWRCGVGSHGGGGMFTGPLAEHIALWKALLARRLAP